MVEAVVAVATAVAGALGAGGAAIAVVGVVVKVGVTLATAYAAKALLSKKSKGQDYTATLRDRTHVIRSAVAPRRIVYGRAKVAGPLVFAASTGENNSVLHMVIPLAGHAVDEIGELYVDDEAVSYSAGADGWRVASSGRWKSDGKDGADNPGILQWRVHLGADDQAADPYLVAAFPGKWTADHRLRGTAYVYVKCLWNADAWSGVPNISAVVKGKRLYDPRTGLIAWSDNPALIVRDYLAADFGIGADQDEIDDAAFIAAANVCDELVYINDDNATQRRYWAGGVVFLDEQPLAVMEKLLSSCAGSLPYSAGQYRFFAGAYRTPTMDLTADDLRGPIKLRTVRARADRCNAVGGTYIDQTKKWADAEFPEVGNDLYEQEDGEAIRRDLDLSFTNDPILAQRLARIELERARQGIVVEWPGNFSLIRCAVMEPVRVTIPELGWFHKVFLPIAWKFGPSGVDVTLQEEAPGVYDWNRGHAWTYDVAPNTSLPNPFYVAPPGGVTVTPATQIMPDGSTLSLLDVAWSPSPDPQVVQYSVQWRAADPDVSAPWQGRIVGADIRAERVGPLVPGVATTARVAAVNGAGRLSVWVYPAGEGVATPDTTPPGPPVHVSATGDARMILLAWENDPAPDLARVEIWGADTPDLTKHRRLASVAADRWTHAGAVGTWFYRLRSVDRSGNLSDWHAAIPVSATGRLLGAAELQQRFIDTSLLLDTLSARVLSVDELAASYTNLALNQHATNETLAVVRTDVNALTTETSAIASQVTTVQTRLNNQTATVQTVMDSVNGVKSEFYVKTELVNESGDRYIAGFGLVAEVQGGQPVSEFLVLADRFGVGRPGVNGGQPVFPFIIMNVNGVPTVVISTAVIGDASIDTLKIAGNAVTIPVSVYAGGSIGISGDWTEAAAVQIAVTDNAPIMVLTSSLLHIDQGTTFNRGMLDFEIRRNGSVLSSGRALSSPSAYDFWAGIECPASLGLSDIPGPGTHRYSLNFRNVGASSVGCTAAARSILLLQTRR